MKFKSISSRLSLIFISILVVVCSSLVYLTLDQVSEQIGFASEQLDNTVLLMENSVNGKVKDAEGLAVLLSTNEDVVMAMDTQNLSLLKRIINPIYTHLNTSLGISVLEFGDANGTVLYRAHNPEKNGDDKSTNPSIAKTLSGSIVSGTEMGSSGLAIRSFIPIEKYGKVIGTIQIGYSNAVFQALKESSHADFEIYSTEKLTLSTIENASETAISDLPKDIQNDLSKAFQGETIKQKSFKEYEAYIPIKDPVTQNIIGAYRVTYSLSKVKSQIITNLIIEAIIILLSILIIVFASSRIKKTVVLPLKAIAVEAEAIASGNLNVSFPDHKADDEIGKLLEAFKHMVNSLRTLIISINDNAQTLASTSEELTATTEQSAAASDEVAKAVSDIAGNAQNQANETELGVKRAAILSENIENVNENMAAIGNMIQQLNAHKTDGINIITLLGEQNLKSVSAIEDIRQSTKLTNESARRIGEANQLIESIAEQTNLLALNAAIEAARAGEAGRGFSVVAEEIRKLAEQSTNSAKDISEMLTQLLNNADHSVKTMETVNQVISKQVEQVNATEEKFSDISKSVEEVEQVIASTVVSVDSMSANRKELETIIYKLAEIAESNASSTQESAASVEEQSASMQEISHSSESLAQIAMDLLELITKFKL